MAYPIVVVQSATPPMVVRSDRAYAVAVGDAIGSTVVRMGFAGAQGIPGPMGPPGVAVTITAQAAVNLTYPEVVAIVNGVAHPADPTNTTDMTSQLAITTQAALAGQNVVCATQLSLTESAWAWTPGRVYLGAPGALTQTPGATGAILEVGRAVSATTVEFDIQTAILR